MNKFICEIQKLGVGELPEIKPLRTSKRDINRVGGAVYAKLAAEGGSIDYKHFSRSIITLRRALAIIAAVILLLGASVTVYAYRLEIVEGIKRILTREEELIDQKSEMIDESARDGEVTLTVEKAIRDGDKMYLYLTFKNGGGKFDGAALLFDSMTLERRNGEYTDREVYEPVSYAVMSKDGLLAGDILYYLGYEPVSEFNALLPFDVSEAGEYRLTIDRLYSCDERDETGAYTGEFKYTDYADVLTVNFSLDGLTEPLAAAEYEPMTEFTVNGATLTLTKLRISPIEITFEVSDLIGQTLKYGGYEFSAVDCLCALYNPLGINQELEYPLWNKFREDYISEDIASHIYQVKIEFYGGVSSVDSSNSHTESGYFGAYDENGMKRAMRSVSKLTAPIYESDIARIYIEREDGDTVTIWENENEGYEN